MPKRLSRNVREHLDKARESALAAVAVYNNPTTRFRTGSYVVLMIIAWTSLLHSVAYSRGTKPWRVRVGSGRGTRYERVGSDYRHWDLNECLRFYFEGDDDGACANLRFLIGLRDRIEHRDMPHLDDEVFGECQAALINFERVLVTEFGGRFGLNTSLAWSLQFSETSPEGRQRALEQNRRSASDSVLSYVRQFRSELSLDTLNTQQFSFKVFMVPQLANHRSKDAFAVEFVHFDPDDPESMKNYQEAVVLIKERHVEVRSAASMLPKVVAERVAARIPWHFTLHGHHARCWQFFEVRPRPKAENPRATETTYCQWDQAFGTYVYTEAWVDKLVDQLSERDRFEEVTGLAAKPRQD